MKKKGNDRTEEARITSIKALNERKRQRAQDRNLGGLVKAKRDNGQWMRESEFSTGRGHNSMCI